MFSGHDHVYERAEHNGIRYFVTGGGGAPLYPRRPQPNPVDVEAVKKFERVLHYLRVTVTGNRVEVTAVRADGTTIETTSWTDGRPGADAAGRRGARSRCRRAPVLAPRSPRGPARRPARRAARTVVRARCAVVARRVARSSAAQLVSCVDDAARRA